MTTDFKKYSYTINNTGGFRLTEALQLWRTKYPDFQDFEKEVITHEGLKPFRDFVYEMWNDIQPVTVQNALEQANQEIRRTYFDCIGVQKLFQELAPELKDRQVIKKKRTRWDSKNDPWEHEFEDVYELYEMPGDKLFVKDRWGNSPDPVYAVRCWCTTTDREYWLYVPTRAATGQNWVSRGQKADYDAIRAIAWTIRIDVEDPERIYRQGDIIVVKYKDETKETNVEKHLTKEEYLQLMYSET
jgi:hypothetical protein